MRRLREVILRLESKGKIKLEEVQGLNLIFIELTINN